MKKYEHLREEILNLHNQNVKPTEIYRRLSIPKSSYLHIRRELNLESRATVALDIPIEHLMEYIVGTVIGDATLSKGSTLSSNINFAHAERYKDYFDYKVNILSELGGSVFRQNYLNKKTKKHYPRYFYASHSVKGFNYLRQSFYPNDKKIIPMDIIEKYFSEKSLAILFMDDGNSQMYNTTIATQCFNKENLNEFVSFLKKKFDTEFTIQKMGPIRLKQKDRIKFYSLIEEEVNKIPSMRYKLKFR